MRLTIEAVAFKAAGWTHAAIGAHFGVSKAAVGRYLARRLAGVRGNLPRVTVQCAYCGTTLTKYAHRVRASLRSYCNDTCYQARIRDTPYRENRTGQRLARLEMTILYGPLPRGSVVHHRDGNCLNNDPANLVLFASQADHMRFHRHGHAVSLFPVDAFFSDTNPQDGLHHTPQRTPNSASRPVRNPSRSRA